MQDQPQGIPTTPAKTPNKLQQWWDGASTGLRIGAGCAVIIASCMLCGMCGLIGNAFTGGNTSANTGNTANLVTDNGHTPTATKAPTKPTATPKPKQWTSIKTFSGSGDTQTDTIHIPDGAHITWQYTAANEYATFLVTIYSSDGMPVDIIDASDASGTYTVHGGGDYYLKVGAANLSSWQISIQVYK